MSQRPFCLTNLSRYFPWPKNLNPERVASVAEKGCLPGRFIADAVSDRDQDTTKLKSLYDDRIKLFTVALCLSERDARIKEFQ